MNEAVTRQRLSADVRREQLMAAAVDTLAELGYLATTADEIARRAGVSKGLLWHYFDDLDDLYERAARRTLVVLAAAAGARIDLGGRAADVIRAAIHAAVGLRETHGRERKAMQEIILNLRDADGTLRLTQNDLEGLYASQEAIFRRGQEQGDFRTDLDPRLLAVTYQGAVDSMLGYLDAYPHSDAGRHADTVAEVLLAGIRA